MAVYVAAEDAVGDTHGGIEPEDMNSAPVTVSPSTILDVVQKLHIPQIGGCVTVLRWCYARNI